MNGNVLVMCCSVLQLLGEIKDFSPGGLCPIMCRSLKTDRARKAITELKGPYRVIEAPYQGAYKLEDLDGTLISQTWNAENL